MKTFKTFMAEKKLSQKDIKRALASIKPPKKKPTLPKAPWDDKEQKEAKVDELNKSTLANYVKKASDDRAKNAYDVGKSGEMNYKGLKRRQGINRAVNKLAKESYDDDEDDRPHTHAVVDNKGRAKGFAPYKLRDTHVIHDQDGTAVSTADNHKDAKTIAKRYKGKVVSTKAVKLKKPIDREDAKKMVGKSIKGHYHEAKEVNEVLDRPGALDSYRKKADASGNKARNSATRKILTAPKDGKRPDHSDELKTMRKRNKGQDMADRVANKQFRKSIGLGYNSKKEEVEQVDEISNKKMGQYVRKATDDAARRAMDAGEKAGRGDSKGFGKQMVKSRQRVKGVQKAMDKMDKNRLFGRQ
jgi:hypothetical protein